MILIDGKAKANKILTNLASQNVTARLAIITVGEDEASKIYVRNKMRACEKVGIICKNYRLPEYSKTAMDNTIQDIIASGCMATIIQLPVPGVKKEELPRLPDYMDVDGFNPTSKFQPCTPKGIMRLLDSLEPNLTGANAVVIGRSDIVGKPVAKMLLDRNCTVTVCHSHTIDLASHTRNADIIIVAAGVPKLITEDMVAKNAIVIDVGINRDENGKLCGDVDFENVAPKTYAITPVPGGVGPMTVAMLMENVFEAYKFDNV